MRAVPTSMWKAWKTGDMVGSAKPMMRAVLLRPRMALHSHGKEVYASLPFGNGNGFVPMELPNIKSITWSRAVDMDAGTCEIQLWNTDPTPIGTEIEKNWHRPGYLTFNRGTSGETLGRWGARPNEWSNLIMPDNVIRTYEGYGYDETVGPDRDRHMVLSGTWLIDEVNYSHDGIITIICRDFARLLLEQVAFPPVVPGGLYPDALTWEPATTTSPTVHTDSAVQRVGLRYHNNSNTFWGVGHDEAYGGGKARHAYDDNQGSYWMSIGNGRADQPWAYEWTEAHVSNVALKMVKVSTVKSGYTVWLSVFADGKWQGKATIPYNASGVGKNQANIPYVATGTIGNDGGWTQIVLEQPIKNATMIRVTFSNLQRFPGFTHPVHVAVRSVEAYAENVTTRTEPGKPQGNYNDYSDIVTKVLAWAGFYWPDHGAYFRRVDGTEHYFPKGAGDIGQDPGYYNRGPDPVLGRGRIWGDIEPTYTKGKVTINFSEFDKQPLMKIIQHVRDITSYVFYIDEGGGAVWRTPNIWTLGSYSATYDNYTGDEYNPTRDFRRVRLPVNQNPNSRENRFGIIIPRQLPEIADPIVIDERWSLMSLGVKLSSRNTREHVFIGNTDVSVGAVVQGFVPNDIGLRRVAGWTDTNFETQAQCQKMGDLAALAALRTYREDQVVIPGMSAIQIDDQVKIVEEVTGEVFLHYVKAITSTWDSQTGEWTYQLTTNWLGISPEGRWLFNRSSLSPALRDYLAAIGRA